MSRDDYVAYLGRYAAVHRLDVRTGVEVRGIEHVEGRWRLLTSAGEYLSDQVVIATGHELVPRMPDWARRDAFGIRLLHVADVTRAADFSGEDVLLVGAGNSGIEMAAHLVDAGVGKLWVSVRTPPNILPREIARIPLQTVGRLGRILPERLRDATAQLVARHVFGDLSTVGLPAPTRGPYQRLRTTGVTAAIDQGFVGHLKAGRLEVVPEVERMEGREAVLRSGRRLRPDVVVLATGYEPGLRRLVGHLGVLGPEGLPRSSSNGSPTTPPGMWFAGYTSSLDGNLRSHPADARRIARGITRVRLRGSFAARRPFTRGRPA